MPDTLDIKPPQPHPPKTHKLVKPIYYRDKYIDEDQIKAGIEVELDDEQVKLLRDSGCIT